jgi:hypothetical protein
MYFFPSPSHQTSTRSWWLTVFSADHDPGADECMLLHYLRKSIQQTEKVYDLMLGAILDRLTNAR